MVFLFGTLLQVKSYKVKYPLWCVRVCPSMPDNRRTDVIAILMIDYGKSNKPMLLSSGDLDKYGTDMHLLRNA